MSILATRCLRAFLSDACQISLTLHPVLTERHAPSHRQITLLSDDFRLARSLTSETVSAEALFASQEFGGRVRNSWPRFLSAPFTRSCRLQSTLNVAKSLSQTLPGSNTGHIVSNQASVAGMPVIFGTVSAEPSGKLVKSADGTCMPLLLHNGNSHYFRFHLPPLLCFRAFPFDRILLNLCHPRIRHNGNQRIYAQRGCYSQN